YEHVVIVSRQLLLEPAPLILIDYFAATVGQHAALTGVDHDQAGAAEQTRETPEPAAAEAVCLPGELTQHARGVVGRDHLSVKGVLCKLSRREIAEMLIDPVRDEGGGDALIPPTRLAHILDPRFRDVPVVVDVMIVEDHRARDR